MRCIEYAQKMNFYDMYVPTLFSWKTWIWLSDSQRRLHVVCWAFLAAWHQLHTKNRHGSSVEFIFPKEFADFSKFHSLVPYTPTQDSWQAIFMFFLTLGVHRELWRDRSLDYFRDDRHNCTAGGAGPNEPWRFHCIRSCSLLLLPLASVLILLGSTSEQTLPQAVYYLLLVMTTATWRQERDSSVRRSPHCSICDGVIAMVGFKKIKLSPSKPFRPWNEMILHDITFHWSLILKG